MKKLRSHVYTSKCAIFFSETKQFKRHTYIYISIITPPILPLVVRSLKPIVKNSPSA